MRATIWPDRIDILGADSLPRQKWEPLLHELKVVHVPSVTAVGKRMAVTVGRRGRTDASVYRSTPIPDDEVIRILAKYSITASTGVENGPPRGDAGGFEA